MASETSYAAGASDGDNAQSFLIWDCLSLDYVLQDQYAERLLAAGVNATNVTFATEQDWDGTLLAFERGLEAIERSPYLSLALCAADIERARLSGRVAVIIGTQGSMMVDRHLDRVGIMTRLGMRYFGLSYTGATLFGDGCGEPRDAGLSFLGRELIDAVNGLPLILDLSHCGHRTRAEAAELARAPVCTHSNAYSLVANDRNTRDETLRAIAAKGGVIGICALPRSVKAQAPSLEDLLDHCDRLVAVAGIDHVGIGLDLIEGYTRDGKVPPQSVRWRTYRPDIFGTVEDFFTMRYPAGMEGIADLPNLVGGLRARDYSGDRLAGILGGNWLRNFRMTVG